MIASHDSSRRIGPIGTASRVVVALGLLLLAGWDGGLSWQIEWYDPLLGLVALPAITVSAGLLTGRFSAGPIQFTGPLAICINCLVIVALVANPYTAGGALLFYGVTLSGGRLARAAGLRGDGALEPHPSPRRPDRLPDLLADRRGRGEARRQVRRPGSGDHGHRRVARRPMRVELLYFEDCPNYEALLPRVRELVADVGEREEVELRRIETDDEARRQRFLGSPTVRVDGVDVDPDAGEREDFGLKCRLYTTPRGDQERAAR